MEHCGAAFAHETERNQILSCAYFGVLVRPTQASKVKTLKFTEQPKKSRPDSQAMELLCSAGASDEHFQDVLSCLPPSRSGFRQPAAVFTTAVGTAARYGAFGGARRRSFATCARALTAFGPTHRCSFGIARKLLRRTPKSVGQSSLRAVCSTGPPHLRAQAKTLGFTEKAKENSKPVLSRLASVDNASDSTTGLRTQVYPS